MTEAGHEGAPVAVLSDGEQPVELKGSIDSRVSGRPALFGQFRCCDSA